MLERFRLHYTGAVANELREEFASGREFWHLVRLGTVIEATPARAQVTEFGPGERAVIDLGLEHGDWIVLIDDLRPFLDSVRRGLKALCTPVLAVDLYAEEIIDASRCLEALARLAAMQTVSPQLIAASLAHLGAIWKTQGGK